MCKIVPWLLLNFLDSLDLFLGVGDYASVLGQCIWFRVKIVAVVSAVVCSVCELDFGRLAL